MSNISGSYNTILPYNVKPYLATQQAGQSIRRSTHLPSGQQSRGNTNGNQFRPLVPPCLEETKSQSAAKSLTGVHVFSLPIRRIRGLTAALNKNNSCEYIFETVGRIVEEESSSAVIPFGVTFRLEELNNRKKGIHLKCIYVDMEDIKPDIYYNGIYR